MYPSQEKGMVQMSNKLFSNEEVEYLRQNPNVKSVTNRRVEFTEEFRARAKKEYDSGKSGLKIFADNGLSKEILGIVRIHGFFDRLSNPKQSIKANSVVNKNEPQKQIKSLEHEIMYLRQENEFLKKIQQMRAKK